MSVNKIHLLVVLFLALLCDIALADEICFPSPFTEHNELPGPATCSLAGKVALVTGAASGIGAATVEAFLANGIAKVYAWDYNITWLFVQHPDSRVKKQLVDVRIDISVNLALYSIECFEGETGGVDIMVLNAGELQIAAMRDVKASDFMRQYDVSFMGVHRVWQAGRDLLTPNAKVLVTVSNNAVAQFFGLFSYQIAKLSLMSWIKQAVIEENSMNGAKNITYAGVFPGGTNTGLFKFPMDGETGSIHWAGRTRSCSNTVDAFANNFRAFSSFLQPASVIANTFLNLACLPGNPPTAYIHADIFGGGPTDLFPVALAHPEPYDYYTQLQTNALGVLSNDCGAELTSP